MNLRDPSCQSLYVSECLTLVPNIDATSQKAMHSTLIDAVNARLRDSGVPTVKSATNAGSAANAEFDFQNWSITFGAPLMVAGSLDALTLGVNTVYHEARHCEQWFRMAQGVAAGKLNKQVQLRIDSSSAQSIATGMWIPLDVAQQAVADTDYGGNSDREVKNWWESVYASSGGIRGRKLGHINDRYDAYRNLPEEVDAWYLGDAVEQAFVVQCPKLGCPSYTYWKKQTKWRFHARSPALEAVDKALKAYEASGSATDRGVLKSRFDAWFALKAAKGGTKRVSGPNNPVDQLKAFLDGYTDNGAPTGGRAMPSGVTSELKLALAARR